MTIGKPDVAIENLTPHAVVLLTVDGDPVTIRSAGPAPRVQIHREIGGTISTASGTFHVRRTVRTSDVTDLPVQRPQVVLIVSRIVAEACPHRDDLVFPDDAIRDAGGTIVGARALGRS